MFPLFSVSPADVDFWINGGWDQPNCGITVNPLFFLQMSRIDDLNGKNCIQGSFNFVKIRLLKRVLTLLWYHEKSYVNSTMGSI